MPTDETAARLGAAVAELHRLLRRRTTRRANRPALAEAQVELLLVVRAHPDVSVKEAARRLRTAPNTVSTLVGDLVDAGLLHRERDPGDRRLVRLRLTDAARQRMADYERHRAELLADALAALDPAARRALAEALPHLDTLAALITAAD
ncbi:MarR family transcriptional regulator [Micromonospora sp. NBC_01655]|uniref:MarR family winged helix-turn-helix transcriptional regulator n=1 Tax=Micromonospora sp. NBC_01655 TaxID=2975983 RepID=UPI0022521F6C|nr:MarR family transcriptional regulator [Micromonospora sp. NBC_01655]MCX4471208.1 MarR family transcriptional regulator [Micromonospora sp. NBC_01655]